MSETYEIKTIQDIFEKVPTGRVKDCMAEITEMILQAKLMLHAHELGAQLLGGEVSFAFPETLHWVDDGRGEVETVFEYPDHPELEPNSLKTVREPNV